MPSSGRAINVGSRIVTQEAGCATGRAGSRAGDNGGGKGETAGVRARQEKVVFVASEDKALLDSKVRPYLGASLSSAQSYFSLPH